MSLPRSQKLLQFINWRVRVTIQDNRQFVGKFLAFDKHLNVVLADCEELRMVIPKGAKLSEAHEEKRILGLVMLRGENIVGITSETPPAPKPKDAPLVTGTGLGRASGRGAPVSFVPGIPAAQGPLAGPVPGLGGPGRAAMLPTVSAAPIQYTRVPIPPAPVPLPGANIPGVPFPSGQFLPMGVPGGVPPPIPMGSGNVPWFPGTGPPVAPGPIGSVPQPKQ